MKRWLTLMLVLALGLALVACGGKAASPVSDFAYEVSNDVIVITRYNGLGGNVTIPSQIGGLPVTIIGMNAFDSCTSLITVTIPDGVRTIRDEAFYDCTALTTITIPSSVTSIGNGVVGNCISLTAINVDSNNQAYSSQDGVWFNKGKAKLICYPMAKSGSYIIPDGVTDIGGGAFYGCTSLPSVAIPSSVTAIGNLAFCGCATLTTAKFEGDAPSAEDGAFDNTAPNFTIYYRTGASGWSNPWNGYPTATW